MFLDLYPALMEPPVGFPIGLVSDCVEAQKQQVAEVLAEAHRLDYQGLILFIFVYTASKTNLEVSPRVVVHQEQHSDYGPEQTSDIGYYSIELGKAPLIDVFVGRLSKDKAAVPTIRHFLDRNSSWEYHHSACFSHLVGIRQDTMICSYFVVRYENVIGRTKVFSEVDIVFVFHVVADRNRLIGSNQTIDVVDRIMHNITQNFVDLFLRGAVGVRVC